MNRLSFLVHTALDSNCDVVMSSCGEVIRWGQGDSCMDSAVLSLLALISTCTYMSALFKMIISLIASLFQVPCNPRVASS